MTLRLMLVIVATALVAGAALGFAGGRLSEAPPDESDSAKVIAGGVLEQLPGGPVQVRAERVVLPAGFSSRHFHGGPTFNFVDSGTVSIESDGRRVRHEKGDFFFEPAGRVHAITVLDDARLRVIRLLPPGVEATTEAP
jgi:quercetin dioxygenase-like cupin family protein